MFCRFVPGFTLIAGALNKKLWKSQAQTFDGLSDEEFEALETLRARLKKSPVLALTQSQGDHIVDTDPCDKQMSCDLLTTQATKRNQWTNWVLLLLAEQL